MAQHLPSFFGLDYRQRRPDSNPDGAQIAIKTRMNDSIYLTKIGRIFPFFFANDLGF